MHPVLMYSMLPSTMSNDKVEMPQITGARIIQLSGGFEMLSTGNPRMAYTQKDRRERGDAFM